MDQISYTPSTGPLAGIALINGRPEILPDGRAVVAFDPIRHQGRQVAPKILIEGRPDLAELVAAYQARQAALDALRSQPGVAEIEAARADEERWDREMRRMMESGSGVGPRPVRINAAIVAAQYPAAAAYFRAEAWTLAAHYAKSSAGRQAIERMAAGMDYREAIAAMEAEWSAHTAEHIWD